MATQIIRKMVDDLDGTSPAVDQVLFSFDGSDYEIDLSNKNIAAFEKDMAKWITAARKAATPTKRRKSSSGGSGLPLSDIRAWAKTNGHKVSDRGRVSAEIVRAYNQAQAKEPATT